MSLTQEDVDLIIISLVQEYPHIYDKKNSNYPNHEMRDLSFEIISEAVNQSRKQIKYFQT